MNDTVWMKTSALSRIYRKGRGEIRAVDGVDLALSRGEFVAVAGAYPSGRASRVDPIEALRSE